MTYNASSRKHIREAEKALLVISTIDREVISGLMSVANGRHWVHEQLARAYVFADPYSPDAQTLAYNCGLRATGVKLFNDLILYAPDNFILMIKEAHERSALADARRAAGRSAEPDPDADTDEFGRWIDSADSPEGAQPTQ